MFKSPVQPEVTYLKQNSMKSRIDLDRKKILKIKREKNVKPTFSKKFCRKKAINGRPHSSMIKRVGDGDYNC